jgi:hypothetical protein
MSKGLLYKTKGYLVGGMQYCEGRAWRESVKKELDPLGIVCLDPYCKPFVVDVDESETTTQSALELMAAGEYDKVAARMKTVRGYDLSMVDRSDFIICYLDPKVPTAGTYEELYWSVRLKRPIFLVIEGGKSKTPLWIMGALPHKYIYNNLVEVVEVIKRINSGEKKMDSERWRLLKESLR